MRTLAYDNVLHHFGERTQLMSLFNRLHSYKSSLYTVMPYMYGALPKLTGQSLILQKRLKASMYGGTLQKYLMAYTICGVASINNR